MEALVQDLEEERGLITHTVYKQREETHAGISAVMNTTSVLRVVYLCLFVYNENDIKDNFTK